MNIVLIEDEASIADYVCKSLKAKGYTVEHFSDGAEGLERMRQGRADLLILDVVLPTINGMEVLRTLRQEGKQTPILILSAKVDLPYRLEGFELGADDYLPKPFFVEELLARVQAIRKREALDPQRIVVHPPLTLDRVTRRAQWHGASAVLSQREFMLLDYLLRSPGQLFSRQKLLQDVWEIDFDPETNVVDVCIKRIRTRLKSTNCPDFSLIESIRGVGYRFKQVSANP
ncbi:MAG: response regulator transcription factor [Betaproteobacteria bacterium]